MTENNKRKRSPVVLAVLFALAFISSVLAADIQPQSETIRIGYFRSESYQDLADDGVRSGYGYDYLQRIADYTHWNYDFVECTWGECLQKIEAGEIDLMTLVDHVPAREEIFEYSRNPFGYDSGALAVRMDAEYAFDDFEKFNGMTVASLSGGSRADQLREHAEKNNFVIKEIIEYSDPLQMRQAVENGDVDAMALSEKLLPAGMKIVSRFGYMPFYVITKKGNTELIDQVDRAIGLVEFDIPNYQGLLYERHYGSRKAVEVAYTNEEKAYLAGHKKLRVVASAYRDPLTYFDETEQAYGGFENTILRQIAKNMGVELEYVESDSYRDQLEKVQDNEADIIVELTFESILLEYPEIERTIPYVSMQYTSITRDDYQPESNPSVIIHPSIVYSVQYRDEKHPAEKITVCSVMSDCVQAVKGGSQDITYVSVYEAQQLLNQKGNRDLVSTLSGGFSIPISYGVNWKTNPLLISILNKQIQLLGTAKISDIIVQETVLVQTPATLWEFFSKYPEVLAGLLVIVVIASIYVFLSRRKAAQILYITAYEDEITGLKNLRWLEKEGNSILRLNRQKNYAVVSMDIAYFDIINDHYSRTVGDDVIRFVASVLRGEPENPVTLVRVKADHFLCLVPYPGEEYLGQLLFDWGQAASSFVKGDTSISLKLNFGVYLIQDNEMEITTAIDRAELARAETKNGPSDLVYYNDRIQEKLNFEKALEDLQFKALAEREFEVYFQPKYNMRTGKIIGAETLVRWRSKEKGFLFPGDFVPLFEQNGFILKLDDYVLEETCKLVRERILQEKKVIPISVNQSRIHMADEHYIEKLSALLNKYYIPKYMIELEVTETTLAEMESAQPILMKVKELGYLISIDDFGSGYSSLTLLNLTPFDILKLDREFLSETYISQRTKNILTHVVEMAQSLNIQVICEGVETEKQKDFLLSVGCLYAQGYYFSKPMPKEEFETLLDSGPTSLNEWSYDYYREIPLDSDLDCADTAVIERFETFLNALYVERNPDKAVSLMTPDVYIFDPAYPGGMLTKAEWHQLQKEERNINSMPLSYRVDHFSHKIDYEGHQDFFVLLSFWQTQITAEIMETQLKMSGSLTAETGEYLIDALLITYISDLTPNEQKSIFWNEKTRYKVLNKNYPGCAVGCYLDSDYSIYFYNFRLLGFIGYSNDEFHAIIQNGFVNLIYPEDREMVNRIILETPEDGDFSFEARYVKKDGTVIWMEQKGQRLMADDGRPAMLFIMVDITDRKNAIDTLKSEVERCQLLVKCTDSTIYEYDFGEDRLILHCKTEVPEGLVTNTKTIPDFSKFIYESRLVHEDDRSVFLSRLLSGEPKGKLEVRVAGAFQPDGEYLWYRMNSILQYDSEGNAISGLGLFHNIDAEKKKISKLMYEVQRDSLTGLFNKSALEYLVATAIENSSASVSHAFIIVDLDDFKSVNDGCGHPYGDVILQGLSEILNTVFHKDDIISRIGGDEFVVFLNNVESRAQIAEQLNTLVTMLKGEFFASFIKQRGFNLCVLPDKDAPSVADPITVSCSMGVSIYPEDGKDFQTLYRSADMALYRVKGQGNFGIGFFSSDEDR